LTSSSASMLVIQLGSTSCDTPITKQGLFFFAFMFSIIRNPNVLLPLPLLP